MKCYAAEELTISSPPREITEPFTISAAKEFIEVVIPDRDVLLDGFISASRETAEYLQGRDLVPKQYDRYLDSWPGCEIELRQPLQSVDLIRVRDSAGSTTNLTEGTDYIVDTARNLVMPAYGKSWPCFTAYPSSAILIRYTSGYPLSHPFWQYGPGKRILIGMKMLVSEWYEQRIPFVQGNAFQEMPYAVTALLSSGAIQRVQ